MDIKKEVSHENKVHNGEKFEKIKTYLAGLKNVWSAKGSTLKLILKNLTSHLEQGVSLLMKRLFKHRIRNSKNLSYVLEE